MDLSVKLWEKQLFLQSGGMHIPCVNKHITLHTVPVYLGPTGAVLMGKYMRPRFQTVDTWM